MPANTDNHLGDGNAPAGRMPSLAAANLQQPAAVTAAPGPPPLKVFVVEDSPEIREFYRAMILATYPHAKIHEFANGDTALERLEHEEPDLLISDLNHLGMDGYDMLSRLNQKCVTYPIIIVSGIIWDSIRQAHQRTGSLMHVRYLDKPFANADFISLVKTCLQWAEPGQRTLLNPDSLGRPLRIVQLDDEECMFDMIRLVLKPRLGNIQLLQFQHSPAAWRILTEARPDLLITGDIIHRHPEWCGESIVQSLVERGIDYPIIVTSGWPDTRAWVNQVRGIYGPICHLPKPFTVRQFHRALGHFFSPPATPFGKSFWH